MTQVTEQPLPGNQPSAGDVAALPALTAQVAASIRVQLSASPNRMPEQVAERVAQVAVSAVLTALEQSDQQAEPASSADVANALLRGDPADELAARCRVRLAPAYAVLVLGHESERSLIPRPRTGEDQPVEARASLRALRSFLNLEHRRDLLATTGVKHDRLVVLLPTATGADGAAVRELAERALRGLGHAGRPQPVAVAGAASRDLVATAVDEACDILHVVRKLGYPNRVYQLEDVPIETSLLRSPDLATLLALRLAPLYGSGAPLQETLRVYLECSQDRRHAARALHVHPNTLDYRLRRIRELTGLSPTVPRDIQTLGAAITASRLTGFDGNGPLGAPPNGSVNGPM